MRPCARIEHDPVGHTFKAVQVLHEFPFVIGLEKADLELELTGDLGDLQLKRVKREPAVDLGIPPAELVEIDPVHDLDTVARGRGHGANSRTAAMRSRA